MTKDKKGYLFIILMLGIAVTGMTLIYAHPYASYRRLGSSGIHATPDGSIHIPGEIIIDSGGETSIIIIHNSTTNRIFTLPNLNGSFIIIQLPFDCPVLRAITGFDANGNPICTVV